MVSSLVNRYIRRLTGVLGWLATRLGLRQSLTRRASFLFVILIAAALLIPGVLAARQLLLAQEQEILARQVETATRAATNIEAFIVRLHSELAVLSKSGHGQPAQVAEHIGDVLDLEPGFSELIIVNREGDVTYSVARGETVLDVTNVRQASWFVQTDAGTEYVSDLQTSPITEPFVVLARPIIQEGRIQGVLAGRVDIGALWNTIANITVGQTGQVYMVSESGALVAHPDASALLPGVDLAGDPDYAPVLRAKSGEAFRFNGLNEAPVMGAVALIGDTDWRVVTELPAREAFAAYRRALVVDGVAILATLAAAFVMLQVLLRYLTQPVLELATAVQQFGAGDPGVRLPTHRGADEIGQLITAFDGMLAQVNALAGDLEGQVTARIRDLAVAAEVGQRIARVRDLDDLLAEAVELIRARFDLYHVQIYLADKAVRNLTLHASSGAIGEKLLQRGHRLPVGLDSINGAAVSRKEAVVVPDTQSSSVFYSNPLLPDTRAELAVPLLLGDQVLGVLDMQSERPHALSNEDLPAFSILAGQLAIAIDNARLFGVAAQAQAEVESYASRLTREGWQAFMDLFSRRERLGYTFDQTGMAPLADTAATPPAHALTQAITVADEPIGSILVEDDGRQSWTAETRNLVNAVARQVAQQVENLRLLAVTEQYRHEAEQAIRRLTREGWQHYEEDSPGSGYLFDQNEVKPIADQASSWDSETVISQELRVSDAVIGHLAMAGMSAAEGEAAELVTTVAQQLSAHIENLRLTHQTEVALAETAEQARRRALLNQLSERLNRAATLHEVYDVVADGTAEILPSDRVSLAILNAEGDQFAVMSLAGEGKTVVPPGDLQSLAGSVIEQSVRAGTISVTNDSEPSSGLGIRSSIVAPLITSAGIIGTLNVGSKTVAAYDKSDESLMMQIASILASVIESRRLLEQVQERAKELTIINEVARTVSEQLELTQLLETVYQQIQRVMSIDAYHVSLYDAETDRISHPILYENGRRQDAPPIPLQPNTNTYKVIQTGRPVLLNLTEEEKIAIDQTGTTVGDPSRPMTTSSIFVPLLLGQRAIGVLAVHSYEKNAYDQSDVVLLNGIASHVAVAVENVRLFEATQEALAEAKRQSEELALVNRVVADVAASLDVEQSLQTIADELAAAIGVEAIGIALMNDDQNSLTVVAEHYDPERAQSSLGYVIPLEGNLLTQKAINRRQTVMVEDAQHNPLTAPVHDGMRLRGVNTLYIVPMVAGKEIVGTVGIDILEKGRLLTPEQVRLAETLVFQAATAVQNARLFETVRARARREKLLREVTEKVRGSADVETIMRVAVKEVGRLLGRTSYIHLSEQGSPTMPEIEVGSSYE